VLENIVSKVTEVGSSNHQVLNMMKMLETQVGQLAGRLSANEGKLPRQPKGPEMVKAIQSRSGKETEDPECSAGARKPKPSTEMEDFAKEEVTEIVTEEPNFEMPGEDTKISQLKPRYFRGKLDNHFVKFVEVVHRLSMNMPLLDALQVPTCSRYFKDILANNYEIETLEVDHVKISEQCSATIANGLEKQKDPGCPTIPCSVGSFKFEKELCDLGASVSVMCSRNYAYHLSLRVCAWSWAITPFAVPWASRRCAHEGRTPLHPRRLRGARDGREREATTHTWEAFPEDRGSYH
jgi:hypothetical protein